MSDPIAAARNLEADRNWKVANSHAFVKDYARRHNLYPAEKFVLDKYASKIAAARLLDLGVGGGRTTRHLISRCRSYIGVDYAPAMIDACRRNFPGYGPDTFKIGDARDLSAYQAGEFDFVIFSYNGLDAVGHEDRLRILKEIYRILGPEGLFLFSTHSLHAYPFPDPEIQAKNAHVSPDVLRRRGWYQLVDRRADVILYYIYPHVQLGQLGISGFEVLEALDMEARPFNWSEPPADWMVHFLCRRP